MAQIHQDLPPAFSSDAPLITDYHLLPPPIHEATNNLSHENHDPAPSYDLPFEELHRQYKSADEAAGQVYTQRLEYVRNHTTLHAKLAKASKDLERLKKHNSALYKRLHAKPSKLSRVLPFARNKNSKGKSEIISPTGSDGSNATRGPLSQFESAYGDETAKVTEIEHLESQITSLENQKALQGSLTSALDDAWQRLRRAGTAITSSSVSPHMATLIGAAEEKLSECDSACHIAKNAITDFNRARVFIQHAHHYFSRAIRYSDALEPAYIDRATVGGFGDTNKLHDYKDAVVLGGKAQVCLNESLRVMKSYMHVFPEDRKADYTALQTLGLMQISDIYNLVYGGRLMLSSRHRVSAAIQAVLNQQLRAYKHLTDLAVWVQDRGPVCENDEQTAEERRMGSRRELADLWMQCRLR